MTIREMQIVYEKLKTADILVITSPVYFYGISAQLKAIIDRLHTPMRNEFPIKKLALILVGAATLPELFDSIKIQYRLKESILLIQNDDLTKYSLVSVVGMDRQELMDVFSAMSEDDKLSIQAYLESKGAWTTEIVNEETKEFGEYHLDVRYNTDTEELVDMKERKESPANREAQLLLGSEDRFGIYQLKDTEEARDIHFMGRETKRKWLKVL